MKKLIIFISAIVLLSSCGSNENKYDPYALTDVSDTTIVSSNSFEIRFKKTPSNTKTIHVKLNDVNAYDALFDTGCSGMVISSLELINLVKSNTLTENDYEGVVTSTIADGSQIENPVYNIKEVTVVDLNGKEHTLRDIKATVIENPGADILIGSSVIDNLAKKSYTVDLNKKLIRFQ